jgi:hypothetical protein
MVTSAQKRLLAWAGAVILVEVVGSFLSRSFSKWVDRIKQKWLRIPVASMVYLAPVLPLLIYGSRGFLFTLTVAAFSFRVAHAAVFGSLNTIGQKAIESDERRAILVSMSSAISAFLISIVFFAFFWSSESSATKVEIYIQYLWYYLPLPCVLLLVWGGYLADRPRAEVR